jgi:hypothetical protein
MCSIAEGFRRGPPGYAPVLAAGLQSTTARDIAEAMQIKPSSVYNTFANCAGVFREALRIYAAEAPESVLRGIAPARRSFRSFGAYSARPAVFGPQIRMPAGVCL